MVRDVLEPDVLRGTRPVLRGGSRSNAASLPDGELLSYHAARLETDSDRLEETAPRPSGLEATMGLVAASGTSWEDCRSTMSSRSS
jgi:hypothetical protein